jgi:protein-S-isoprenylcysteine O-methyltransferase Ste14
MAVKIWKALLTVLRVVYFIGLLIVILFLPAGTLHWPEAWVFLIMYLTVTTIFGLYMRFKDPELYKERTSVKKDTKPFDRIILVCYLIAFVGMLVLTGFDAVRFRWSAVPLWLKIVSFAGFFPVSYVFLSVTAHNTFLSGTVRIQNERGHHVCTTGPYRIVRHPMYTAIILLAFLIPPALGSFYGWIGSAVVTLIFLIRTYLEDRTLQTELEGYREYARKVRFRLVPGIW